MQDRRLRFSSAYVSLCVHACFATLQALASCHEFVNFQQTVDFPISAPHSHLIVRGQKHTYREFDFTVSFYMCSQRTFTPEVNVIRIVTLMVYNLHTHPSPYRLRVSLWYIICPRGINASAFSKANSHGTKMTWKFRLEVSHRSDMEMTWKIPISVYP